LHRKAGGADLICQTDNTFHVSQLSTLATENCRVCFVHVNYNTFEKKQLYSVEVGCARAEGCRLGQC